MGIQAKARRKAKRNGTAIVVAASQQPKQTASTEPTISSSDLVSVASKKRKRGDSNEDEQAKSPSASENEPQEALSASENHDKEPTTNDEDASAKSKQSRQILFIGNLPPLATRKNVTEHFSSLSPTSVRVPTDREFGSSRGYAFIEFDAYDKLRTCLTKFHHSLFPAKDIYITDDEKNAFEKKFSADPKEKWKYGPMRRRISVELTAGGGGKSSNRMQRVSDKNKKLKAERQRASDRETKARDVKRAHQKQKDAAGQKASGNKSVPKAADADADGGADADAEPSKEEAAIASGIHPSRLKNMGLV